MIRRLIILLLIVGCDFAPTEHEHDDGVCVWFDSSDRWLCYPEIKELKCEGWEGESQNNAEWIHSYATCEELCASEYSPDNCILWYPTLE